MNWISIMKFHCMVVNRNVTRIIFKRLFERAVVDSQQSLEEGTKTYHISSIPSHA